MADRNQDCHVLAKILTIDVLCADTVAVCFQSDFFLSLWDMAWTCCCEHSGGGIMSYIGREGLAKDATPYLLTTIKYNCKKNLETTFIWNVLKGVKRFFLRSLDFFNTCNLKHKSVMGPRVFEVPRVRGKGKVLQKKDNITDPSESPIFLRYIQTPVRKA